MGLRNVVGSPVVGPDFFDRDEECGRIWRRLETDHVLLPSPRRVGKTSILRRLQRDARAHGFAGAVFVDVGGAQSEDEFVDRLIRRLAEDPATAPALRTQKRGPFARLLGRVQALSAAGLGVQLAAGERTSWQETGRSAALALRATGRRWLILLDELGVVVQGLLRRDPGGQRARTFLQWLRNDVRQDRPDPGASGELRFVVASSIGLPTLADLHRLSDTINDLHPQPVDAFAPDVADRFLGELAEPRRMTLEPAVRARIREHVGWTIPYFLQAFFAELAQRCGDASRPTTADVDAVFDELLSVHRRGVYFDWWSQRLDEELGRPRADWAKAMLSASARTAEGCSRSMLEQSITGLVRDPEYRSWALQRLPELLESDGYWVLDGGRYRFRSGLLRAFWNRKFGDG